MLGCRSCATLQGVIERQNERIRELEMTQLALVDKAAYKMLNPSKARAETPAPESPTLSPAAMRSRVFEPPISFEDARATAEADERAELGRAAAENLG